MEQNSSVSNDISRLDDKVSVNLDFLSTEGLTPCGNALPFPSKDVFPSGHFTTVLTKIDEVDESHLKSPSTTDEDDDGKATASHQSPHVMWKSEDEIIPIARRINSGRVRPKSANSVENRHGQRRGSSSNRSSSACDPDRTRRQHYTTKGSGSRCSDSESNSECSFVSVLGRPKSAGSKPKPFCHNCYSWDLCRCYCPVQLKSSCITWVPCESNMGKFQARRCRSNPNVSSQKAASTGSDLQIDKFKRSLRLLGLEVTDFGIYDTSSDISKCSKRTNRRKRPESTFSTKVVKRSISLDGLKEEVREAWLDDRLDSTHRRLLAQAAYEEWYFRKAEEAHKRMEKERLKNKLIKEKLEDEFRDRRMKAEEEFEKWIEGKRKKIKIEKNSKKSALAQFRVVKTREEIDIAYKKWKKDKDKEREKRQKEEELKNEKKLSEERQKEEKKAMAEKAFIEWKRKLEETEKKLAEAKMKKEKRKKELERKSKEKERKTSFQTWKDMKDRELMLRRQELRNITRVANALRSERLEERMYEAEQAFEEWLEKIERREADLKSKKSVS